MKNANTFLLIILVSCIGSCSHPIEKIKTDDDCRFLHSVDREPVFNNQRSETSVQLRDNQLGIERPQNRKCEIETGGYPTDLIWLYPFTHNFLIYVEESALGMKLNLVDIEECKITKIREVPTGYHVSKKLIWTQQEDCDLNKSTCARETIFKLDRCKISQ